MTTGRFAASILGRLGGKLWWGHSQPRDPQDLHRYGLREGSTTFEKAQNSEQVLNLGLSKLETLDVAGILIELEYLRQEDLTRLMTVVRARSIPVLYLERDRRKEHVAISGWMPNCPTLWIVSESQTEGMLWDVTLRQSRNADVTVKVRSCDERGRIEIGNRQTSAAH